MFKVKQLAWLMGCASVISGCAWLGGDKQAVEIKPVMHLKHAPGSAGSAGAMYTLGRYYQGKANYTEAIAAYEKALAENPAHTEAHNGLGVSYSRLGRHELALQHFRKAIELSPLATHLHNNVGYIHLLRGQQNEAAAAFEQALRLEPENRQARSNLAALYQKAGLHDKAAMLTASNPGTIAADPTKSSMATSTLGNPPVFTPVNMDTTAERREVSRDTKDTKDTNTQLVQVAPNVFEFRLPVGDPGMDLPTSRTIGKTVGPRESYKLDSNNVRVEVSNGNGATGMAKQVSSFLQQKGYAKPRLTDRPPFDQAQTEIHYRRGHGALAAQISEMLPKHAPLVESNNLRIDIQVRVMLGKDFTREVAYFDNSDKMRIAGSTSEIAATN
jgi:tetratricopeptide (TPR) repeat protein